MNAYKCTQCTEALLVVDVFIVLRSSACFQFICWVNCVVESWSFKNYSALWKGLLSIANGSLGYISLVFERMKQLSPRARDQSKCSCEDHWEWGPLRVRTIVVILSTRVPLNEALFQHFYMRKLLKRGIAYTPWRHPQTKRGVLSVLNVLPGAAMGFPLSPIVADLFMETFIRRALKMAVVRPKVCLWYVDDILRYWIMMDSSSHNSTNTWTISTMNIHSWQMKRSHS